MPIQLMGVINLTPDSFSDGGQFLSVDSALKHAEELIYDGANCLDIGAESSRPGATPISVKEEINRLSPFLKRYHSHFDCPLSLDTYKSEVAELGIENGIRWVNDISGLKLDHKMLTTIQKGKVGIIIMHMQNNPKTMQNNPTYDNLINTIYDQLHNQINQCENANIKDIIIDPGIGFGKTLNHNLKIIKQLKKFSALNYPILIGTSRKSFIGTITNAPVNNREAGTIASSLYAIQQGADIIRVHNVKDMKQALVVWEAINNEKS